MPNRYQDDSEFHVEDLAVRHLEGDLTPSEYDVFEERIQKDPEAREALINLCLDATAIREMQEEVLEKILGNSEDDSNSKPDDPQVGFDSPPSRWPDPPLVFGAISFSSILLLITGLTAMYLFSARSVPTNNLTQYVARVSKVSGDCRREDTGETVHSGDRLPSGAEIQLLSGNAHVTFRSGASVVLDGPSDFSVFGPNDGHLAKGHMIGKIPNSSASGFSITTPAAHVVDLGTEFAVRVDEKTGTALEVFDGRVRFADKRDKSSVHLLEVGQRMRFTARRFFQEQPQGRPCFAELLTSVHELERAVIAEHPLAYWRFENVGESPIVPDASGNGHHGLKKNGASVSPIDGIAGGALKLDGVDDYVEVPDSPELSLQDRSLTVLGWINVRDVTQEHPLVATGLNEDGKSPHTWSVSLDESGNFEAGVNLEPGRTTVADASDADLRDGTWRQIAFVLDREKGEQRYYVDGRLVSTTPIDSVLEGTPIRCEDSLRIGMDAESDCTEGYIDEVAVFLRVLSDEKIAELYDAAKK